jgi:hypothetical protein
MTVVDVLGSVDELADGMGGSLDAVTGGGDRSISEIPVKNLRVFQNTAHIQPS